MGGYLVSIDQPKNVTVTMRATNKEMMVVWNKSTVQQMSPFLASTRWVARQYLYTVVWCVSVCVFWPVFDRDYKPVCIVRMSPVW